MIINHNHYYITTFIYYIHQKRMHGIIYMSTYICNENV